MVASRRQLLKWIGYGVGAAALPLPFGPPAYASWTPVGKKLVVVALRGGVDGLHLVPPIGPGVGDDFRAAYEDERPGLHFSLDQPLPERVTLPIAGHDYFRLHPQLGFFADVFSTKPHGLNMAIVHGVGGTGSRSHFSSLDALEQARPLGGTGTPSGWLSDALDQMASGQQALPTSPLNGVAMGTTLPESFTDADGGFRQSTPVPAISQVTLTDTSRRTLLDQLYGTTERHRAVTDAAAAALGVVDTLAQITPEPTTGPGSFDELYPSGDASFNRRLADIARLITDPHPDFDPLSIFTVDYSVGWDTHRDQVFELDQDAALRIENLSTGLRQFYDHLGGLLASPLPGHNITSPDDVCTLLFTDFGRTVDENNNGGTDHGNGGTMFVIGGDLPSSRVIHTGWDFDDFGANCEATNSSASNPVPPTLNGLGSPRTQLRSLIDFRSVYRDILENVLGLDPLQADVVFGPASISSAGIWSGGGV